MHSSSNNHGLLLPFVDKVRAGHLVVWRVPMGPLHGQLQWISIRLHAFARASRGTQ